MKDFNCSFYDQAVAQPEPVVTKPPSKKAIEAALANLDLLAKEVGKAWQVEASAVAAVREMRCAL